ncbi:2-C-methyl-D-erythritol 4-phosphate cytidylyltransferase [Roseibium aggregatum]|uniref:2-C-methyl-D-erythritol 4-phosphate cytidylyltransferase n=1 Tax=Roseibium aggregatum TaxID=187304 RepID=A0A939ECH8_9HYPH|nr:2-C-methyl-D-erythritol 4-phosphate cytidylyltransferase [Roseibium aggregatum]
MTVPGGSSRQESVYEGLKALSNTDAEHVLFHETARLFVFPALSVVA